MTDYTFHTIENSDGERKEILQSVKDAYGFVPNLFGYMAEAPVTLKAYLDLNKLISQSSLPPALAQVALLTASIENKCEFCSVAHQAMAKKFGTAPQTVHALINNEVIDEIKDQAVAVIVREIINTRGWVNEEALDAFYSEGFTQQQYFELILVVTIKTLSNYINHQTQPRANNELLQMIN